MMTWILRLVGWFCMFTGISLVFRPLTVMADVIPLFGSVLEVGVALLGFAIATPLTLLTIAIAWIAAGLGLLIAIFVLARMRKKSRPAQAGGVQPHMPAGYPPGAYPPGAYPPGGAPPGGAPPHAGYGQQQQGHAGYGQQQVQAGWQQPQGQAPQGQCPQGQQPQGQYPQGGPPGGYPPGGGNQQ
jgi:hypothetical protein